MIDDKSAIDIISNVIECEIEYAEDAGSDVYAADLSIALEKVKNIVNDSIKKRIESAE